MIGSITTQCAFRLVRQVCQRLNEETSCGCLMSHVSGLPVTGMSPSKWKWKFGSQIAKEKKTSQSDMLWILSETKRRSVEGYGFWHHFWVSTAEVTHANDHLKKMTQLRKIHITSQTRSCSKSFPNDFFSTICEYSPASSTTRRHQMILRNKITFCKSIQVSSKTQEQLFVFWWVWLVYENCSIWFAFYVHAGVGDRHP